MEVKLKQKELSLQELMNLPVGSVVVDCQGGMNLKVDLHGSFLSFEGDTCSHDLYTTSEIWNYSPITLLASTREHMKVVFEDGS